MISRTLLLGAPYVLAHRDTWLSVSMSTVPGLCFAGGLSLLIYIKAKGELSGRPPAPTVSRRGANALLGIVVLTAIGVRVFLITNTPIDLVMISGMALGVVAYGTWMLCALTAGDQALAMYRISWFLLALALVVADSSAHISQINAIWSSFSGYPDSASPALAFAMGAVLWYPLNLFLPFHFALERFHRLGGSDAMDRFLFEAAESSALILLTLADGKFYIGQIKSLAANPLAPKSFVRILPLVSGYRDHDTKELNFTSFYEDVYDELVADANFSESWLEQFIKILPFSTIISANHFDPDMYERFIKDAEQYSAKDPDVLDLDNSG